MIQTFTIRPKTDLKIKAPSEERLTAEINEISYTIAFVGPYTYSWETRVDNDIHVWKKEGGVPHNFHIGNGNAYILLQPELIIRFIRPVWRGGSE